MKKKSIGKIIGVVGIFLLLIVILLMVVDYKVRWEHSNTTKYLYFYKCLDSVCVNEDISEVSDSDIYSKYKCNDECPVVMGSNEKNIIILNYNGDTIKFNYKIGKVEE